MSKQTKREAERQESIMRLKEILNPGDTIHAICRNHNRRSGTTQWDFYKFYQSDDGQLDRWYLTFHIHKILGYRLSSTDSLCLPYMNMDPAFQIVYALATVLFRDLPHDEIQKHDPRNRYQPGSANAGYLLNKANL